MSGPTPGPWSTDGKVLRDANGNSIASGGNNRVVQGAELEASLRLAAAAPLLLQALVHAERVIRGYTESSRKECRLDDIQAAIRAATGKAAA